VCIAVGDEIDLLDESKAFLIVEGLYLPLGGEETDLDGKVRVSKRYLVLTSTLF
jgi:hypothetical protein